MANLTEGEKRARLNESMSRAAKLMKLEANGTLDKIASAHKDGINESLEGGKMTQELMTTAIDRKTQPIVNMGQMGDNAMNVPSAIRESFASNPISDASIYSAFGGGGGMDDLAFLTEGLGMVQEPQVQETKQIVPPQNIRQIVNEGITPQTQYAQQSAQIDYPMIRTIVEEIVRKYAVSLKKNILSESKQPTTNTINTIALGETFKFLDSAGNIYEAKLVKKGNINKKKVNG